MSQRKKPAAALPKRTVWRISESAPLGEYVDLHAAPRLRPREHLPEPASFSGGWVMSSFELLNGTDVTDSGESVSDELFDELFATPAPNPDKPTSA